MGFPWEKMEKTQSIELFVFENSINYAVEIWIYRTYLRITRFFGFQICGLNVGRICGKA